MRREYDFSGAVRGKYAKKFKKGTNVVVLSPDVSDIFPNSESVNSALRGLMKVAETAAKTSKPRKRRA